MNKCCIEDIINTKKMCPKANKRLKARGSRHEELDKERCPWHISSKKHHNCFWLYHLDPDNQHEHTLTEIAKILRVSINNIKLIQNCSLAKVKEILERKEED